MCIKNLWSILGLYELQGKTVAIDLSCWICEAQNIPDLEKIMQPDKFVNFLDLN